MKTKYTIIFDDDRHTKATSLTALLALIKNIFCETPYTKIQIIKE